MLLMICSPVYANQIRILVHACTCTCLRYGNKVTVKTLERGAVKRNMLIYAQNAKLTM